jgi:hypothetical protein
MKEIKKLPFKAAYHDGQMAPFNKGDRIGLDANILMLFCSHKAHFHSPNQELQSPEAIATHVVNRALREGATIIVSPITILETVRIMGKIERNDFRWSASKVERNLNALSTGLHIPSIKLDVPLIASLIDKKRFAPIEMSDLIIASQSPIVFSHDRDMGLLQTDVVCTHQDILNDAAAQGQLVNRDTKFGEMINPGLRFVLKEVEFSKINGHAHPQHFVESPNLEAYIFRTLDQKHFKKREVITFWSAINILRHAENNFYKNELKAAQAEGQDLSALNLESKDILSGKDKRLRHFFTHTPKSREKLCNYLNEVFERMQREFLIAEVQLGKNEVMGIIKICKTYGVDSYKGLQAFTMLHNQKYPRVYRGSNPEMLNAMQRMRFEVVSFNESLGHSMPKKDRPDNKKDIDRWVARIDKNFRYSISGFIL